MYKSIVMTFNNFKIARTVVELLVGWRGEGGKEKSQPNSWGRGVKKGQKQLM